MSSFVLKAAFLLTASAGFLLIGKSSHIASLPKKFIGKLKEKKSKLPFEPEKINFC